MAGAPNDEMRRRELVEVVTDYLEGKLPVADRVRLEEHLAECPYCEEYIAQMRETIDALGELPGAESLDPRTEEDLRALKGNKGDQQYDIPEVSTSAATRRS